LKRKITFNVTTEKSEYLGLDSLYSLNHRNGAMFLSMGVGGEHQKIARALKLKHKDKVRVTFEVLKK